MSFFSVVDENAARHPVARAAAKARLRSTLRTFQIQLFTLDDGSVQPSLLVEAMHILQVAAVVADARKDDTPGRLAVIRGALSACIDRIEQGFVWRSREATAIDRGLTEALAALDAASATEVRAGWKAVQQMQEVSA